ncbi:Uncharacterised protein [Klebsiella pneumoniae]|nr:Uncharacterised protein [Klebsiella pneumoniae]
MADGFNLHLALAGLKKLAVLQGKRGSLHVDLLPLRQPTVQQDLLTAEHQIPGGQNFPLRTADIVTLYDDATVL